MVLRSELDLAGSLKPLRLVAHLKLFFTFLRGVIVSPVKTNRRFQNEEDVIPCPLNLADRFRDPVGFGKGIIDCISQFLHQVL